MVLEDEKPQEGVEMDASVKSRLNRLKEGLEDYLDLFGDRPCRFGVISSSPPVSLPPAEWGVVDRYVVPIRVGPSLYPGRAGTVAPDPLAGGTECLSWRGDTEAIESFREWAIQASATLRRHQTSLNGLSLNDPHYGALCAFFHLAVSTEALSPMVKRRVILPAETIFAENGPVLPSLAERRATDQQFAIVETTADGAEFATAVLEFLLLGDSKRPFAARQLARSIADEFGLPNPLSEEQALFVQLLRDAHGEYRTFDWMKEQQPLLKESNKTRFVRSLPTAIRKRIEGKRGSGYRWTTDA
jgi:hypothetical protein